MTTRGPAPDVHIRLAQAIGAEQATNVAQTALITGNTTLIASNTSGVASNTATGLANAASIDNIFAASGRYRFTHAGIDNEVSDSWVQTHINSGS